MWQLKQYSWQLSSTMASAELLTEKILIAFVRFTVLIFVFALFAVRCGMRAARAALLPLWETG